MAAVLCAIAVIALVALPACNGGFPLVSNVVPVVRNYTLTVTATSGTDTHTTSVSIAVN